MPDYTAPGVYIQENEGFPNSIAQVETAIPVFIGYTEKAQLKKEGDLKNIPLRISSMVEYVNFFGNPNFEKGINVEVDTHTKPIQIVPNITNRSNYLMYYSLKSFYLNGGGPCYIVSVGDYSGSDVIEKKALIDGLEEAGKIDEITLIVYPDGINMVPVTEYYSVLNQSLSQCNKLQDRFLVCDICIQNDPAIDDTNSFRNNLVNSTEELKYGAAYYPHLEMQMKYHYVAKDVTVKKDGASMRLDILEDNNKALFDKINVHIKNMPIILPPSSAIAGIYSKVDHNRGVWRAPANVNIDFVIKPTVKINNEDQETLNVDVLTGKSINAIRSFIGRGSAIIWGARTLAGNDNEWRYIPVRRFVIMVEESIKKGTLKFVFEPNDSNTWVRMKSSIENFLVGLWQAGALAGSTPEHAFYVRVGLGETMTSQDILEGRLIVEIGMAVVRPAEFIILKFSHKMQEN